MKAVSDSGSGSGSGSEVFVASVIDWLAGWLAGWIGLGYRTENRGFGTLSFNSFNRKLNLAFPPPPCQLFDFEFAITCAQRPQQAMAENEEGK